MQLSRRQIIAYVAVAAVVVAVGVRYVVLPKQAGPSEAQAVVLAPVAASASPAISAGAGGEPGRPRRLPTSWCTCAARCARRESCGSRPAPASPTLSRWRAARPPRPSSPRSIWRRPSRTASRSSYPSAARRWSPSAPASSGSSGGALGVTSAGGTTPGALININTASLEELDALDGVGPSTAQKIIDYRTENGGFKTIDEIKEVPGIGDAKFAAMKDQITV